MHALFDAILTLDEFAPDKQNDAPVNTARYEQEAIPTANEVITAEEEEDYEYGAEQEIRANASRFDSEQAQAPQHRQQQPQQPPQQQPRLRHRNVQQRDTQVLAIMQRIRSKLEGKDFGMPHKLSVSEQVGTKVTRGPHASSSDTECFKGGKDD